ncbi:hypothetical protein K523DRAFT_358500, partial [Schizophyllum commune Tattone D]
APQGSAKLPAAAIQPTKLTHRDDATVPSDSVNRVSAQHGILHGVLDTPSSDSIPLAQQINALGGQMEEEWVEDLGSLSSPLQAECSLTSDDVPLAQLAHGAPTSERLEPPSSSPRYQMQRLARHPGHPAVDIQSEPSPRAVQDMPTTNSESPEVVLASDDTSIYDEATARMVQQQRSQALRPQTLLRKKATSAEEDQQRKLAWEKETADFRAQAEAERERARQRTVQEKVDAEREASRKREEAAEKLELLRRATAQAQVLEEARLDSVLDELGNRL